MEKRKRRAFAPAYKAEVVELVRASGKSIGAVAKDLGLTETAVRAWVRQAEVDGGRDRSGALTTAEREELTQLRRRVKTYGLLRQGKQVRFQFVAAEKAHYSVALVCRCRAVSAAGFYAWHRRRPSDRAEADRRLAVEIAAAHAESRRTGASKSQ